MSEQLKMKELERRTGVGRETIRFYIHEGLLPEPERPSRNVAWYDESFVERIRLIKELQEKRYLPLAVIKSILATDDHPSGAEIDALLAIDGRILPAMKHGLEPASERLREVAQRLGLAAKEIRSLAEVGLFEVESRDGDQWLSATGIRMTELWARARDAGFTEALGFRPESVRVHVDMVRLLARQELRLFTRAVAGRVDADAAARMAEQGIELLGQMLMLLRRETLLRYVAEGNVPGDDEGAQPPDRRASGSAS